MIYDIYISIHPSIPQLPRQPHERGTRRGGPGRRELLTLRAKESQRTKRQSSYPASRDPVASVRRSHGSRMGQWDTNPGKPTARERDNSLRATPKGARLEATDPAPATPRQNQPIKNKKRKRRTVFHVPTRKGQTKHNA